ncbi:MULTISPECIES: heavy-metal-associated domain-containing protein [unclassified Paludibacterium]|uniref:heavy-metal-associated domain-containing protein n=1 Tax=unclassified Paludibacterium TaxID=2618429 RepID=UPI001C0579F0|nr:heavy metal-associated domain-containing protein [Paludibacterium sp. B53371]BEV73479.1 copper chaperone CopZ [Paludibacterium sp. THUN1379]
MSQQVLQVQGMSCGGCAASVEKALKALDGVEAVAVDLPSGRVTVELAAELAPARLADAVRAAGFDVA